MQLRYIRPFGQYEPGDVVDVPDGADFDPYCLERVPPVPDPAAPAAAPAVAPATAPKEM